MWIESEHADRNFMYQLYNNFSGCLSEEDKKKLKKIENYCGHQTLMKIFVKCYYLDISGSRVWNEIIKHSRVRWIEKTNWNCIIDSYSSFRAWFSSNPDFQQEIIDSNYWLIHNEVLSCCWGIPDVKETYLWWEDYLSEDEVALKARKEIHSAFWPKTIVKFRKDMSKILDEYDVYNTNSEAFKLSQKQGGAKSDEQTIYKIVVNKLLSDYWYALEERKSNRITRDRRYLRGRLFKIISCYKKRSQYHERQEEILRVMMESNYGPNSDTIVVDWEVVPNSQKLNRWGELQDKECLIGEEIESVDNQKIQEIQLPKKKEGQSKDEQQISEEKQIQQLELFPDKTKENVPQENIQWSQINTWETNWITIHIDRDDEDEEGGEDSENVKRYRWQNL